MSDFEKTLNEGLEKIESTVNDKFDSLNERADKTDEALKALQASKATEPVESKARMVAFTKTTRTPAEELAEAKASDRRNLVKTISEKVTKGDFTRWLKARRDGDIETLKALQEGTDSEGGYLVPPEHYTGAIAEIAETYGIALPNVTQIPMGRETMDVPTLDTVSTAAWVAEEAEAVDADPAFGNAVLTAAKLWYRSRVSNELLEDSIPAVDAIILDQFARARAKKIDDAVFNGAGSGASDPHTGILNVAGTSTQAAAATTLAYGDLTEMEAALTPGALMGAGFWVNTKGRKQLRNLTDDNGLPIWQQALGLVTGTAPGTAMGYPVGVTASTDAIPNNLGAGTNETVVILGNLAHVYMGVRTGFEIKVSDQVRFEFDQTVFAARERVAITVVNPAGFNILTGIVA